MVIIVCEQRKGNKKYVTREQTDRWMDGWTDELSMAFPPTSLLLGLLTMIRLRVGSTRIQGESTVTRYYQQN